MPTDFTAFFVASTGAAAALVGLLFVAVSISPERTVGVGAPPERQMVAEGAFTALTNAFFVSFGALIPGTSIGVIAAIVGAIALWHTVTTGARMLKTSGDLLTIARRLFYAVPGLVVYGLESYYALQILGTFGRRQPDALYNIPYVLMAVLAIGLGRAWQLLGAPSRGILSWLSPLHSEQASERKPGAPRT